MEMGLSQACWALETGYCLWVGAGLSRQVAAGHTAVPLWGQLTLKMESAAGIQAEHNSDFPNRLDKCVALLGESVFNNFLREHYYTELCCALLSQAAEFPDASDFLPNSLRAVAALGQLANPIVSFNIEPLSSLLLARPAGPVRILFQQPRGKPAYTWREPGGRFQRLVYHPHGLAIASTVMTATQYKANSQTLAFGVAVHAAFANTLAIVGMSLDDQYLRQQIEQFRESMGPIYWFNSQFSDEQSVWAKKHGITTVCAEWNAFWEQWSNLPIVFERQDLAAAWYLAVSEATEEAEGGYLGSLQRSLNYHQPTGLSEDFKRLAERLSQAGTSSGESGKKRLIEGKEPRAIESALRMRLNDAHYSYAGYSLPNITKMHG